MNDNKRKIIKNKEKSRKKRKTNTTIIAYGSNAHLKGTLIEKLLAQTVVDED